MQNSLAERSNNIRFTSSAFVQLTLHNTIEDDDEPDDDFPTEAPCLTHPTAFHHGISSTCHLLASLSLILMLFFTDSTWPLTSSGPENNDNAMQRPTRW